MNSVGPDESWDAVSEKTVADFSDVGVAHRPIRFHVRKTAGEQTSDRLAIWMKPQKVAVSGRLNDLTRLNNSFKLPQA